MQLTLGVQLRWFVLLGYLEHALQYTLSPCSLAAIAESTHTHTLFYIAHPATPPIFGTHRLHDTVSRVRFVLRLNFMSDFFVTPGVIMTMTKVSLQ